MGGGISQSAVDTKFEEYAQELYLRSPNAESLTHVVSSSNGMESIMNFLKFEYDSDNFKFLMVRQSFKNILPNNVWSTVFI